VEIFHIDKIGQVYKVLLRDIEDEHLEATFHSSCGDFISQNLKLNRVLILYNPAVFQLNKHHHYLVVMPQCLGEVFKCKM
jgi:hypothetical protein